MRLPRPWPVLLWLAACNGPSPAPPRPNAGEDAGVFEASAGVGLDLAWGRAEVIATDGGWPDAAMDAPVPADASADRPPVTYDPEPAACTRPPCINVINNCPIPLWTHAVATLPIDDGRVRRLEPGQQFQYAGLTAFGGGRLYAYYKEPENKQDRVRLVSDFNQFVEMTLDTDGTGAWAQNYNISYVDYAALPVAMQARGEDCGATRCAIGFDDWVAQLARCPTDRRFPHGAISSCTGSYNYCITPDGAGPASYDDTRPYCKKMQDAHGLRGSAVYGGVFPDRPATDVAFWDGVAAWNRGTFSGDRDDARYYQAEPHNHYARWIHRELGCLGVYAFSTDDHQDKAGFVRCASPELNVVWCPAPPPALP